MHIFEGYRTAFVDLAAKARAYAGGFTIGSVIMLVFTVYIVAALLPDAITTWIAGGNESWGTAEYSLWGLGSIVIIFAVVYGILKMAGVVKK